MKKTIIWLVVFILTLSLGYIAYADESQTTTTYEITWLDEDGSVLAVTEVEEGTLPVYDGVPTKESDAHYNYTFKEWTPKIRAATSNKTYTAVYTKEAIKYKVTLQFNNIRKVDGTFTSSSESNTLGAGTGWNFTQKKLDNKIPTKSFCFYGIQYTYAGQWLLEDGSVFTGTYKINGNDLTGDTVINMSPVYDISPVWRLIYKYIDNISTGSGSWSNIDAFESFTHTFREPDGQPHYQFVFWQQDNGSLYHPGDTYQFPRAEREPGSITEVNTYAVWQPSVTIVYHDVDGNILKETEAFNSLNVYDYTVEDEYFIGWATSPSGEVLDKASVYELPATTTTPVERTIYNVYEVSEASYITEYYLENLDGTYDLTETKSYENISVGKDVDAEILEYKGYHTNDEESSLSGKVSKEGLVLKVYYDRNLYKVTYKYKGTTPSNASKLPKEVEVKFGTKIKVANAATAEGYTFSGWDHRNFTMPAKDVVISGSFTAIVPETPPTPPTPPREPDPEEPEPEPEPVVEPEPEPEPTPTEDVTEEELPIANADKYWSVLNLILLTITATLSVVMFLMFFKREIRYDENGKVKKQFKWSKLLGILPGAGAFILFILKENMHNTMVWTDKWTIYMVIITLVNAVLAIVTCNKDEYIEND